MGDFFKGFMPFLIGDTYILNIGKLHPTTFFIVYSFYILNSKMLIKRNKNKKIKINFGNTSIFICSRPKIKKTIYTYIYTCVFVCVLFIIIYLYILIYIYIYTLLYVSWYKDTFINEGKTGRSPKKKSQQKDIKENQLFYAQ